MLHSANGLPAKLEIPVVISSIHWLWHEIYISSVLFSVQQHIRVEPSDTNYENINILDHITSFQIAVQNI